MGNPVQRLSEPYPVVIPINTAITASINLEGRILVGVYMSAAWTPAGLSFQGSSDGATWYDVHTDAAELTATAAAGIYVAFDPVNLWGITFLKVRSGTSGTSVNQAAARTLILMLGDASK